MAVITNTFDFSVVGIDDLEKALSTYKNIQDEIKRLEKLRQSEKIDSAKYVELSNALALLKNKRSDIIVQQKEFEKSIVQPAENAVGSYKQLDTQLKQLRQSYKELSQVDREGGIGKGLLKNIGQLDGKLKEIDANVGNFQRNVGNYPKTFLSLFDGINPKISEFVGNLGGGASGFNAMALAAGGVGIAVSAISKALEINAKISDLEANVQKAANLTAEQAANLTQSLTQLDTRTSTENLLKIAEIGGQLGVEGEQNVLKFAQSIDKLNVALGDEFKGGTEEITDTVGKLSNVLFGTTKDGDKLASNLLSLGNALNELGASGSATAPVISDFANRIGGSLVPLGVSQGKILGLSATLQELNVTAERGGSAINRIFLALTNDTERFAKVLNLPLADFTNLVNTDLFGAFNLVTQKVGELATNNVDLGATLKALKIDGQGETEVFLKLSESQQLLKDRTDLATESLKNQDSITKEFDIKNNTLAGSLEKLQKKFTDAFINSGVSTALSFLVNLLSELIGSVFEVVDIFGQLFGMLSDGNTLQKEYNTIMQESIAQTQSATNYTTQQFEALKKNNATQEQKKKVLNDLKAMYPNYLQNLDVEKLATLDLATAQSIVNQELTKGIKLKALNEQRDKAAAAAAAAKQRLSNLGSNAGTLGGADFGISSEDIVSFQEDKIRAELDAAEKLQKQAEKSIDELSKKQVEGQKKVVESAKKANTEFEKSEKTAAKSAKTAEKEREKTAKSEVDALEKIKEIEAKGLKELEKVRTENAKAAAQSIDNERLREIEIENQRFEERKKRLENEGKDFEQQQQKQLSDVEQQLGKNNEKVKQLRSTIAQQSQQIQAEANKTIQSETEAHNRKLSDIEQKYNEKTTKEKQQKAKERFEIVKNTLEKELRDIEIKGNEQISKELDKIRERIRLAAEKGDFEQVKVLEKSMKTVEASGNLDTLRSQLAAQIGALSNARMQNVTNLGLGEVVSNEGLAKLESDVQKTQSQITEIERKAANERIEIAKLEQEKKAEQRTKLIETAFQVGQQITGALIEFEKMENDKRYNQNIANITAEYEKKKELAQGNQAELDIIEKEFQAKKKDEEVKQIQQNAKLAKAQAATDAILGFLRIFATSKFDPITTGVLAATTAITLGLQVVKIQKQADMQIEALKAEHGIVVGNSNVQLGKVIQGKRHSAGGETFLGNNRLIEAEQGEFIDRDESGNLFVINRKSTQKYNNVLNGIANKSFEGKGSLLSLINSGNIAYARDGIRINATTSNAMQNNSVALSNEQINTLASAIANATFGGVVMGMDSDKRRVERESSVMKSV